MTKTRAALIASAFALAATLGMTASIWNPITRAYDRMTAEMTAHTPGQVVNDAAFLDSEVMTEEDPGWNCMTMGNRICGPNYHPVSQELADALAEGEDPNYDWESCLVDIDDTTTIVCPDGKVITS